MWARVCEILMAIWILATGGYFIALFMFIFAALSFFEKLRKMHLLQVIPAFWMLYLSYSYPTYNLPFQYQNYIVVALNLLIFAIIPSNASDHPRPWKKYLAEHPEK